MESLTQEEKRTIERMALMMVRGIKKRFLNKTPHKNESKIRVLERRMDSPSFVHSGHRHITDVDGKLMNETKIYSIQINKII